MGLLRKIPLGTRYLIGFMAVLFTGFTVAIASQEMADDYKALWNRVLIYAVIHWLVTAVYVYWERRWFRFLALVLSLIATSAFVEMSFRVWK